MVSFYFVGVVGVDGLGPLFLQGSVLVGEEWGVVEDFIFFPGCYGVTCNLVLDVTVGVKRLVFFDGRGRLRCCED